MLATLNLNDLRIIINKYNRKEYSLASAILDLIRHDPISIQLAEELLGDTLSKEASDLLEKAEQEQNK